MIILIFYLSSFHFIVFSHPHHFSLHRPLSDVGILVNNVEVRRMQQKLGIPFLCSSQAIEELQEGLLCDISPLITMFITPTTRHHFPSQAPWSHIYPHVMMMGMEEPSKQALTTKEITTTLVEHVMAIIRAEEVPTTAPLITIGLDSFGFVSIIVVEESISPFRRLFGVVDLYSPTPPLLLKEEKRGI